MISDQSEVRIRKLSPELSDDYFAFFDDIYDNDPWLKYDTNRFWGGCYCTFYDDARSEEEVNASEDKRTGNKANRKATIIGRRATGLLAYAGPKVVGWCNVAPRERFANLRYLKEAVEDPNEKVGAVTCVIVSSGHRSRGVGTQLINAACDLVEEWGLPVVEGYPRNPGLTDNPRQIPEENLSFRGTADMFLRAGFKLHRDLGRFLVVRKGL